MAAISDAWASPHPDRTLVMLDFVNNIVIFRKGPQVSCLCYVTALVHNQLLQHSFHTWRVECLLPHEQRVPVPELLCCADRLWRIAWATGGAMLLDDKAYILSPVDRGHHRVSKKYADFRCQGHGFLDSESWSRKLLRCASITEAQAADRQIWAAIADLMSERGWDMDAACMSLLIFVMTCPDSYNSDPVLWRFHLRHHSPVSQVKPRAKEKANPLSVKTRERHGSSFSQLGLEPNDTGLTAQSLFFLEESCRVKRNGFFFRPSPLGFRQVDQLASAWNELTATIIGSWYNAFTAHQWTQQWCWRKDRLHSPGW